MLFAVPLLVAAATSFEVTLVTVIATTSTMLGGLGLGAGFATHAFEASDESAKLEQDEPYQPSINSSLRELARSFKDDLQQELAFLSEVITRDFRDSTQLSATLHQESQELKTTLPSLVQATEKACEGAAILREDIKQPLAAMNKAISSSTDSIGKMTTILQGHDEILTKVIATIEPINKQLAAHNEVASTLNSTIISLTSHAIAQSEQLSQLHARNQLLEAQIIAQQQSLHYGVDGIDMKKTTLQHQIDRLEKQYTILIVECKEQQALIQSYVDTITQLDADFTAQEDLNQVLMDALQEHGVVLDNQLLQARAIPANGPRFFQPTALGDNQTKWPANRPSTP